MESVETNLGIRETFTYLRNSNNLLVSLDISGSYFLIIDKDLYNIIT